MTLAVFLAGLAVAAGAVVLVTLFVLQLWSVFERRPEGNSVPVSFPEAPRAGAAHWIDQDAPTFDWPERGA